MLQLNMGRLHDVLRDFYALSKIRIVIFDAEFRELMAYPPEKEAFCALLRQNPNGEAACRSSDKRACLKCAKTKSLVRYTCHAGLTESVVPVFYKGGVLAYVMFGQVLPTENYSTAKQKLINEYPDYADAIDKLPIKSAEELTAAGTVLQAITTYVMTNRWLTPGRSEFIRQVDQYIEEHISQNISIDGLCDTFHVGRSRLYEMASDYLGCGLAEYIRIQRINYAKKLLLETNMPIMEIGNAVGFVDYNHFSKVFKHIVGISARYYRTQGLHNKQKEQ